MIVVVQGLVVFFAGALEGLFRRGLAELVSAMPRRPPPTLPVADPAAAIPGRSLT